MNARTAPGFSAPVLVSIEKPDFTDRHLLGVQSIESARAVASALRNGGYRVIVRIWHEGTGWDMPGYTEERL